MATQLVLLGVPAFVGQVTGATTVGFWIDENTFDPGQLISVDLSKNTSLPASQWATDVEVDIATTGGFTTIGPTFNAGPHVGACYLAERIVAKYKTQLANFPPSPDERYQYQAILRSDDAGNVTRFHGTKAQVISRGQGTLVHVAFIKQGQSQPGPDAATRWIDTGDQTLVDAKANGFTTLDGTSALGTVGSLFITQAAASPLIWPPSKVPNYLGW